MTAERTNFVLGAEIERLRAATYCSARGGVEVHASPELWQNVRKFGEAIAAAARREGAEAIMREVFTLHEDTIERYHDMAERDPEGKQGAYARGRCVEAKSIARAIGEVARALPAGEE